MRAFKQQLQEKGIHMKRLLLALFFGLGMASPLAIQASASSSSSSVLVDPATLLERDEQKGINFSSYFNIRTFIMKLLSSMAGNDESDSDGSDSHEETISLKPYQALHAVLDAIQWRKLPIFVHNRKTRLGEFVSTTELKNLLSLIISDCEVNRFGTHQFSVYLSVLKNALKQNALKKEFGEEALTEINSKIDRAIEFYSNRANQIPQRRSHITTQDIPVAFQTILQDLFSVEGLLAVFNDRLNNCAFSLDSLLDSINFGKMLFNADANNESKQDTIKAVKEFIQLMIETLKDTNAGKAEVIRLLANRRDERQAIALSLLK